MAKPPLQLSAGQRVSTPRGAGTIASFTSQSVRVLGKWERQAWVLVRLDLDGPCSFRAADVKPLEAL